MGSNADTPECVEFVLMPVLKRLLTAVLAIGAMGALVAPATPAAERVLDGRDRPAAATSAPQARSSASDDPLASTDQDAVTAPDGAAGGRARGAQDGPVVARAAASTTVTISDFKFSPKSITVNVGDTVTWTNKGPEAHSATAKDGRSFDTGLLQKGESGSAKFDKVGNFAYICTPHPFMKGMVKVVAKGSSSASGGASPGAASPSTDGASGAGAPSSGGAASGGASTGAAGGSGNSPSGKERLADTGTNTLLVAATGLGLLLCGLGLRLLPRRA